MRPFHYAFKVKDLASTRKFYIELLGCEEGRSSDTWVDFDFFGNQLSAHISNDRAPLDYCGLVDGIKVPIPHFGCLIDAKSFTQIQERLETAGIEFLVKPQTRYQGEVGEQRTMFVLDLSGNPLEFKSYSNDEDTFSA